MQRCGAVALIGNTSRIVMCVFPAVFDRDRIAFGSEVENRTEALPVTQACRFRQRATGDYGELTRRLLFPRK